jgi:hypothetical protein
MAVDSSDKWRYTLYTTAILVALFNVYAFKLVHKVLSPFVGPIASSSGCPTPLGFAIHAAVFTLALRYSMDLGR